MKFSEYSEVDLMDYVFEENKLISWLSFLLSILMVVFFAILTITVSSIILQIFSSIFLGLSLLRLFSLYHEYNHGAILSKSIVAKVLMWLIGFFLMSPTRLWKYYHGVHHTNNSKFSERVMGDYPTITLQDFKALDQRKQRIYLLKRSFWVILFGYITVFIISFCINPFKDNPSKNYYGILAVIVHLGLYVCSIFFLGGLNTLFLFFLPLSLFGFLGGLIFYVQHNGVQLVLFKGENWTKQRAALYSSNYIKMNLFWRFFGANVGFHNVHHLNSKIPHYRLPDAMKKLEEKVDFMPSIKFSVGNIISALKLKVYDTENDKLVSI